MNRKRNESTKRWLNTWTLPENKKAKKHQGDSDTI